MAQGISRYAAGRDLHKNDDVTTPYGELFGVLEVVGMDEKSCKINFLNPFAFLWHVASTCEHIARFLTDCLAMKCCRLAFYCDGVKPGNVLRPDKGRSFEAFYWTILELPSWFRARVQVGWFPFAFIERSVVDNIAGGMGHLARLVLETFFPVDPLSPNFETGILLKCGGQEHLIRGRFGCWLADERALKDVVSCKGSSGYKPCVCCMNVVGRTIPSAGGNLVHYTSPNVSAFVKQTEETLAHMARDLESKSSGLSKARFGELEKFYGIGYNPHAILFHPRCRALAKFPDSVFWDWMHCLVASGGVAQYQCNRLLLVFRGGGLPLKDVDQFARQVSVPRTWQRLRNTFYEDRTVEGDDAHMKAFASEMLTAIAILGIFIDAVVRPMGAFSEHIKCFDDLRSIVFSLKSGDAVFKVLPELRRRLASHHVRFLALYEECAKPKLHYLKHCIDCIERHQCNLNCFGTERKNKLPKNIAGFTYNRIGKALLKRLGDSWSAHEDAPVVLHADSVSSPLCHCTVAGIVYV